MINWIQEIKWHLFTCAWCRKLTSSFSLLLHTSASKSFPFWVIPVSSRLNNREQDNSNSKALSNQIQMHFRPLSLTALAWLIWRHSEKVLGQYVLPPHPPGNCIPIYTGGNRFLHMHECRSDVLIRWECSFIPRPFPLPAVSKDRGGRPGRSGHMQFHQVDRG